MPELGPYGSMRGARGNSRPYRDHDAGIAADNLTNKWRYDPIAPFWN